MARGYQNGPQPVPNHNRARSQNSSERAGGNARSSRPGPSHATPHRVVPSGSGSSRPGNSSYVDRRTLEQHGRRSKYFIKKLYVKYYFKRKFFQIKVLNRLYL